MVTSTVILSLLTTVTGYGFPSGKSFEPGAIYVGLPASAIPNMTMSHHCITSAVAALVSCSHARKGNDGSGTSANTSAHHDGHDGKGDHRVDKDGQHVGN